MRGRGCEPRAAQCRRSLDVTDAAGVAGAAPGENPAPGETPEEAASSSFDIFDRYEFRTLVYGNTTIWRRPRFFSPLNFTAFLPPHRVFDTLNLNPHTRSGIQQDSKIKINL